MVWAIVALSGANVVTLWLWYRTHQAALGAMRDHMAAARRLAECLVARDQCDASMQTLGIRIKDKSRELDDAHLALRETGGRCDALAKTLAANAAPERLGALVNDELRTIANIAKGRPPTHR